MGAEHPQWKGDAASKNAGRMRARRRYRLGPCEHCGKPATDRHHKDDNPLNNDPGNVEILCRRCHMIADGRIKEFVKAGGSRAPGGSKSRDKPIKSCMICGRFWKYLRKGRCSACDQYFRAHGKERTASAVSRWHFIHGTTWNQ
jgi:hypothetical protein